MKRRRRKDKDSEQEERDDLARERRERARKARGGLGAKVSGGNGGDSKAEADAESKSESAASADAKKAKPEEEAKSSESTASERRAQRERLRASRAAADKRREAEDEDEDTETSESRKDDGRDAKPAAKSSKDAKRDRSSSVKKPDRGRGKSDESKRPRRLRRRGAEETVAGKKATDASKASGDSKGAGSKDSKGSKGSKPARKRGAAAKGAGAGAVTALKSGAGETRNRIRKAAPGVAAGASKLLASGFALFFVAFGFVLTVLIAIYRFADGPVRAALRAIRRVLDAVSRQVTPVRVLALVVAGAAVLLALSQFAVYRDITIGNDAYAPGIGTVAPPPVAETADTGSAHSYLMVPLAIVSLIVLGAALTGRWRLCRLIALAGLVAIAVGLIHDRPAGLDPGQEAVAYIGVKATLEGGFYAQLFSGLLLTLSSLLLGRELKLSATRRPARAPRGSRERRRLLRRNPRVEGARA